MATSVTPDQLAAGREYEKLFVPALFKPWTPQLLAAARVEPGCRVLDVACGTGVLARDALTIVGPDGAVSGLDPAPGMLAVAAEREPRIDWLLGSAESLPVADRTFDRVIFQFGMMFFADQHKAAAEMLRVLKPGGRITRE